MNLDGYPWHSVRRSGAGQRSGELRKPTTQWTPGNGWQTRRCAATLPAS